MDYKMMLNSRGKYVVLKISSLAHFSKATRNSYILTLCLSDMWLVSIESTSLFSEFVELIRGYKMILNYTRDYAVFKIFSLSDSPKAMKKLIF